MKQNKNVFVQKTVPLFGYVCAAAALLLSVLEIWDVALAPKPASYGLFGVFFLSQSLTQENRKKQIWGCCLAVGWFLVALMHCF